MLNDRYRLVDKIDEGGMGEVWRGTQVALGREVAIKVIRPEQGGDVSELRERFQREAELAARVEHRNVINIIDFGTTDGGSQFLVMPFLRGESLEARLRRQPTSTLEEILRWTRGVLGGLGAIHDQGIVHRDLKPANIFLAHDSDGVVPKLLDFGISRAQASGQDATALTRRGVAIGTPQYMAPEQFESASDVDPQADIFSLGVVLYEAISGKLPFEGETAFAIHRAIFEDRGVPLSTLRPELPGGLTKLVDRALSRAPEARFESARQMRNALDSVVISGVIVGVSAQALAGPGTPMNRDLGTAPTALAATETEDESPSASPSTPQVAEVDARQEPAPTSRGGALFFGALTLAVFIGAASFLYDPPAQAPVAMPEVEPLEASIEATPPAAPQGSRLGSSPDLSRLAMRWARLDPAARPEVRFVPEGNEWAVIASPSSDAELVAQLATLGDTTPEPVPWDETAGLAPSFVRATVRLNVHTGPSIESDTLRVIAHDTQVIALEGEYQGRTSAVAGTEEDALTYFVVSRNDAGWARSRYLEAHRGCMPLPGPMVRAATGGTASIRRDMTVSRTLVFARGTRHDVFLLAARDVGATKSYVGVFEASGACRVRGVLSFFELEGVLDEYFLTETAPTGGETLLALSTHPEERPPGDGVLDWELHRMASEEPLWSDRVPTSSFLSRGGAVAGTRDRALRNRPRYVLSVRQGPGDRHLFEWLEGELVEAPAP